MNDLGEVLENIINWLLPFGFIVAGCLSYGFFHINAPLLVQVLSSALVIGPMLMAGYAHYIIPNRGHP